jgi:hypothetical protein
MRTWEKGDTRMSEAILRSSSATTVGNACCKDQEIRDEARELGRGVGGLRRRTAHWLAWSLGILCGALLAFTLLLFALNRFHQGVDFWGPWVQETVAALTFPAIGILILSRRPQHPIGWLFLWAGLAGGLDHFFGEYAIYALQARPEDPLPGGEVSAWIVSWMWVPFNALLVYVALLYPDGRPPSERWRPVTWIVGIAAVVAVSVEALLPIPVCDVCSIENPLGIDSLGSVGGLVDPLIEAFWYGVLGLVAVASLYARFRHAGFVERQQIKWLAYAASVVVLGATLAYGVHGATGVGWTWPVGITLTAIGLVGTPIAVGVAISWHHLYEIDALISRTIVYGSLTAAMAGVYEVTLVTVQHVLLALTHVEDSQLAYFATAMVMAAVFEPLKRRIDAFVERYLLEGDDRAVVGERDILRAATSENAVEANCVDRLSMHSGEFKGRRDPLPY